MHEVHAPETSAQQYIFYYFWAALFNNIVSILFTTLVKNIVSFLVVAMALLCHLHLITL